MTNGRAIYRLLLPRFLWLFLGVILLIEAIYTTEEFTSLIDFIIRNGGSVTDTIILSVLQTPEVIDFALPIAILVSIYFAVQSTRDSNELVVCAAAGVSWMAIPRFALMIGILGMLISLTFSTVVTPMAAKANRVYAQALKARTVAREITQPSVTNAVRVIEDYSFITTPSPNAEAKRGGIFVFQPDEGAGWRATQAQDWSVEGPREDGTYALNLIEFNDYRGLTPEQQTARGEELDEVQRTLQGADFQVRNLAMSFRLDDVIRPVDRSTRPHEQVLFVATLRALWVTQSTPEVDQRIGAVISRAVGCLWAAMLAVAAVAFSNTALGRYSAIPLGVVGVMGGDVIFRALIIQSAGLGTLIFVPIVAMLTAITVLLPFLYLLIRGETLLIPRRGAG